MRKILNVFILKILININVSYYYILYKFKQLKKLKLNYKSN